MGVFVSVSFLTLFCPFFIYKKPTVIGGQDTQYVADVFEQDRPTTKTIPIASSRVEAERDMGIIVLMLARIQAGTTQPVTTTDVTHAGQTLSYGTQQHRIDRIAKSPGHCLARRLPSL